jgi:translation initiation factor IF-2
LAARVKVIDLAKELGVTSKDLIVALEGMGHKGVRAMTPVPSDTANELRVKLGRGRDLPVESKPKRPAKPKEVPAEAEVLGEAAAVRTAGDVKEAAGKRILKPVAGKAARGEAELEPVVESIKPAATLFRPAATPALPVPEIVPDVPELVAPVVRPAPPSPVVPPPMPAPTPVPTSPSPPVPVVPMRPAAVVPAPPADVRAVPVAPRRTAPMTPPAPIAPARPATPPPPAISRPAAAVPPVIRPAAAAVTTPPRAPARPAPGPVAPPGMPEPPQEIKRELIKLPESVTVGELAAAMRRKSVEVIKALLELGVMATVNEVLDATAARLVADRFHFDVEVRSLEGEILEEEEADPSQRRPRPPVVTVMGHVDHGKTSLLDAIRTTKVAEREFGGITQHIGAYQVDTAAHGRVTFLDTPGHEAFTAMRARGAQATDIVILVVAADDGVMPQTVEAINHARAAAVPIIVAVNKIDKPGSDPDRVKRELANLSLVPEEWGGETIFVHTSAKRGDGVAQLLEMTALQAEVLELRANPSRAARGVIVEGRLDRGRGPVATALIQSGTLKEGDAVVVGSHSGRIRAMFNDRGKKVASAGPSDPVELLGLSGVPQAGDTFLVVADERKARQIATVRTERDKLKGKGVARVTLEDLHKQIAAGEVKELRLILKADVQGSVEALTESLERLSTDEVRLKVIHGSVGTVNESDVMLASASNAIVLGFNVKADAKAAATAQADGVDLRSYNVIYDAINDVKAALSGMLAPEIRETLLGRAQVRQLFPITKVGTIYGSSVTEGKMVRGARVRIKRGETVLGESTIVSLKRFKDDVREVLQGLECGIGVEGIRGVSPNDVIEAFTTEEVARTL